MIEKLNDLKNEIASYVTGGIPMGLGHELLYECLTSKEGQECLILLVPNFVATIADERSLGRLLMNKIPYDVDNTEMLYADQDGIQIPPKMTAITHWSFWNHDDGTLRVEAENMFDSMIIGMVSTILLRELESCVDGLTAAASLIGEVDGSLETGLLLFNKKNEIAAKKLAPRADKAMWAEGLPLDRSFFIPDQEENGLFLVEVSSLEYDSYGPDDPPPAEAGEDVKRMWGVSEVVSAAFDPNFRVLQFSHGV